MALERYFRKRSSSSSSEPVSEAGSSYSLLSQDLDNEPEPSSTTKRLCETATVSHQGSAVTEKMRLYNKNMRYNPTWQTKWTWVVYEDGMLCSVCMKYGKPPPQARGAWVTRPVKNWAKATELLAKHEKGKWYLASVEAQAWSGLAEKHGDVMGQMLAASELERQQNRELIKELIRSLYFLVRHRIPHTTTFEDLQIENGNDHLKTHKEKAPSNATYLSKVTIVDLLKSISHALENELLLQMKASPFFLYHG